MNKYQKALVTIKQHVYEGSQCTLDVNEVQEIKYLQELVDRATPKKAIEHHYEDVGEETYIKYNCPICNKYLHESYCSYCVNCGQAIDWSE